ncbi:MAG TPA: RHS repeat-associated core domain-containing protein [Candidatus Binataceae bacterium]
MLSLTAGSAVNSYTYDGGGRRETVAAAGQTTAYLYDGATPVQITAGSTSTNIVAIPGSNEILSIAGIVPIHDALGSVLGGVNSSGALQYQYTYDPFGNFTTSGQPPSGYGNVYGMAGIEIDPTGLYHANARYYSPALTRFVSEDAQRGKANMFTYAGNGPIGNSDISGMQDDDCPDCDAYANQSGSADDNIGHFSFNIPIFGPLIGWIFSLGSTPTPTFQGRQFKFQLGATNHATGIDGALMLSPLGGTPNESGIQLAGDMVQWPPLSDNPADSPGPDWEWHGDPTEPQGSKYGSWVNKGTGWRLHPDFGHDLPKGDHYDLQHRQLGKHSLRIQGTKLQLWSDGTQEWNTIFDFTWFIF